MEENTVITIAIIARGFVAVTFAISAAVLAYYNKPGWGWMFTAALLIGWISVEFRKDKKKDS